MFPLSCIVYGNADGAPAEQKQGNDWTLNLKDVDIRVFLEQISAITGDNFVVDPEIKGKVTIIATTPMNATAVSELLLTVLRVNGLAAIPSGSTTRIVPLANSKLAGVPGGRADKSGQSVTTRVFALKNIAADDAIKLLKPLVSATGYIEGSEVSGSLIVSDYADNVNQIQKSLKSLDKGGSSEIEVIPLKEAWVGNIASLIEAVAPMELAGNKTGRNRLRVVADERTNSIIVRGDLKERQQIRKLIETFDQKNGNASDIQMFRLQYADATEIATLLRGMTLNNKLGKSTATTAGNSTQTSSSTPQAPGTPAADTSASPASNNSTTANSGTSLANSPFGGNSSGQDLLHAQSFIQPDVMLNALVVRAEPSLMSDIRALIRQLDVPRSQILIEAAIVEIDANKAEQLGIQLAGGNIATSLNAGTTQFSNPGSLPLSGVLTQLGSPNAAAFNNDGLVGIVGTGSFNVLVQALSSITGVNLLSTPSLITLDNEEARITVGQNVPFRTGEFTTQSTGTVNPFTTIDRQDIGVTLQVVPQVLEGNLVRLNIEQEVSSIAPTTVQSAQAADLITNKRAINTKVVAQSGQTIVLGGLIEDDTNESVSKIPLLGDLPLVGFLFRNKSQSYTKTNLFVFLRPTVLHGAKQVADITQERYGRVYDLVIGEKNLDGSNYATPPAYVPPASTLYSPITKSLPWLVENGHPTAVITAPAPPAAEAGTTDLPWLKTKNDTQQAAPVMSVETMPTPGGPAPLQSHAP